MIGIILPYRPIQMHYFGAKMKKYTCKKDLFGGLIIKEYTR